MRKKALESLMRKREEERVVDVMRERRGKEDVERRARHEVEMRYEVDRRAREEGRKIIIPLNDESTSNSESSSSDTDSQVGLDATVVIFILFKLNIVSGEYNFLVKS